MKFANFLFLLVFPAILAAQEGSSSERHPLFQNDAVLKAKRNGSKSRSERVAIFVVRSVGGRRCS